jgi:hypothetical protein
LTGFENWQIIKIMKKLPLLLICIGLLFVSVTFSQKKTSGKTKNTASAKKKSRPAPKKEDDFACQLPAMVNSINLSQTEIILSCPSDDNSCSSNKIIKVRTSAMTLGDDKFVYHITAGKIIGEGENVEWDLTDVKPGTYAITAGISQYRPVWGWQVLGETKTQVVTIKEYADSKKTLSSQSFVGVPPGFVVSTEPHTGIISGAWNSRPRRPRAEIINIPADVTKLTLNQTEITANCVANSNLCKDEKRTVEISTEAFDKEGDVLVYNYVVSAGKIVGQGYKVIWDLSGVAPGIYTITAGVDDGCGICGETKTMQVTIKECPDCKE